MSDTNVVPDAGAPPAPAPAPASNEVVINQNPTAAPAPVGSQAPPKGEQATSRRDAIQKAFNRSRDPNTPKPKPAEAKMGHNQPPEETKREARAPAGDQDDEAKLDLKKRPSDQPQPRGERGQFAPRAAAVEGTQTAKPQSALAQQAPAHRQLPENAPYRDPPARMTEKAKGDWHAAPETVRGEVHRMHQEFSNAYHRYRGDHETMNSIRQYHELATSHGTTLDKALNNYVSMEHKLRTDPVAGLDIIVNNLNLKTPDGQKLGLRDIAYHILSQTPDQHKALQTQNQTSAISQQLGQLHQQNQHLAQTVQQMQYERQFSYTRSEVDRFADSHPRFDEVAAQIEQELKFGYDLETAYQRACLLSPGTAAQTRTTTAQTRPTDRSISGAPDGSPSNGPARKSEKPVGRRAAIANAIKRVNGGV